MSSETTLKLCDHAEAWAREQGIEVPERRSPEWAEMYRRWASWAFDFDRKD